MGGVKWAGGEETGEFTGGEHLVQQRTLMEADGTTKLQSAHTYIYIYILISSVCVCVCVFHTFILVPDCRCGPDVCLYPCKY